MHIINWLAFQPQESEIQALRERIEGVGQALGDEILAIITRKVLRIMQENATIDWTVREDVRGICSGW